MSKTEVKQVKKPANVPNLIFRDDGTIRIENVRISYPHLFEPYSGKDSTEKGKFGGVFYLDKSTHKDAIKTLNLYISDLCVANFGQKLPADSKCLRDGKTKSVDPEDADDILNKVYMLSASEKKRPLVIDRDRTPLTEEDDKIYPGCRVNVIIALWAQDNKWGKKLNANLKAVQFLKDDERFGEAQSSVDVDAFDDLDEDGGIETGTNELDNDDFGA